MEIPNVKQYENKEKLKNVDFLDEKLELSFSIYEEAAIHLPEITDEEFESHKEKYRILLGDVEVLGENKATIQIKGILEADPETEKDLFYSERKESVVLNLNAIKKWVANIQEAVPECKEFYLVGDIHTHPVKVDTKKGFNPCAPSRIDIEDVIRNYENGTLSQDKPFIFCVAGRDGEETKYAFYRLVKKDDKYTIEQIQKK